MGRADTILMVQGEEYGETNKVMVLFCWPRGAPLPDMSTALATRMEECQLSWELDTHSQINQSLWGSRSQELEGRARW